MAQSEVKIKVSIERADEALEERIAALEVEAQKRQTHIAVNQPFLSIGFSVNEVAKQVREADQKFCRM